MHTRHPCWPRDQMRPIPMRRWLSVVAVKRRLRTCAVGGGALRAPQEKRPLEEYLARPGKVGAGDASSRTVQRGASTMAAVIDDAYDAAYTGAGGLRAPPLSIAGPCAVEETRWLDRHRSSPPRRRDLASPRGSRIRCGAQAAATS